MRQGSEGQYWTADGIELWAPTASLVDLAVEQEQANIASMILKVSYAGHSIILGGDATGEESWPTIYPDLNMREIAVLKASHHGRKSGFHGASVAEMAPWLTITSVGDKEHDATDQYRRHSENTVSLRKSGDIVITIADDGTLYYPPTIENVWKAKLL